MKKLLSVIVSLCMILPLVSSLAVTGFAAMSGVCGDNITWSLSDDGVLTITGTGDMTVYPSLASVPWNNDRDRITSAYISEGVTSISSNALASCHNMTDVSIPDTLESFVNCVSGCTSLTYNEYDGVKYLGNASNPYVFLASADDYFMTEFSVPSGTRIINEYVFNDYIRLKSVELPGGLVSIGSGAFANCPRLVSINMPSTLKYIRSNAFSGCTALEKIDIPAGIELIQSSAFSYCTSLTSFIIPFGISEIATRLFNRCTSLTTLTVPSSVTSIMKESLAGCTSLKDVYYGGTEADWQNVTRTADVDNVLNSVTIHYNSICGDRMMFSVDPSGKLIISGAGDMYNYDPETNPAPWYERRGEITSILIDSGITSVGDGAFAGLSLASECAIPSTVTGIGSSAFSGCSSLSKVYFTGTSDEWNGIAVSDDNSALLTADIRFVVSGNCGDKLTWMYDYDSCELTIDGAGDMWNFTFENQSNPWSKFKTTAKSLVISEGATSISESAFSGFKSLEKISVPNSLVSIGNYAFEGCPSQALTTSGDAKYVGNPSNPYLILYKLDESASNCSINPSTKIIASYAFCDCSRLRSIEIPDGVIELGDGAFANCSKLTSINIPRSVTAMNGTTFSSCSGLTSMTVDSENPKYHSEGNCIIETAKKILVSGCNTSVIPADGSVTEIGKNAFHGRKNLTEILIPNTVTWIDRSAFGYCTALTEVIIPDSVTFIGISAFQNCTGISTISIPDNVYSISDSTFEKCSSLSEIYLPRLMKMIGDSAFADCKNLKTVFFAGSYEEFSMIYVFNDSGMNYSFFNATLYVNSVKSGQCGDALFWEFDGASGTLAISGEGAMYDYQDGAPWSGFAEAVKSVSLPSGITYIGEDAFAECTSLTDIYFDGKESTFAIVTIASGNEPLTSASFHLAGSGKCGDSVTWKLDDSTGTLTISGVGAMNDFDAAPWYDVKDSIKEVRITSGVTSIGSAAFAGCSALEKLLIPDSVSVIGQDAFDSCSALSDIYFGGTAAEWNALSASVPAQATVRFSAFCGDSIIWTFDGVDTLTLEGEGAIYSYASAVDAPWRDISASVKYIYFPSGIVSVGNNAFAGFTALSTVYYGAIGRDWSNIAIGNGNGSLTSASRKYAYYIDFYESASNRINSLYQYYGKDFKIPDDTPTKTYTVKFDPGIGIVGETTRTFSVEFISWNTESNGKGVSYAPGSIYSGNKGLTLYAVWDSNPNLGELPVPSHENYSFIGWFTSPVGGTEVTPETVISSSRTLYAHWDSLSLDSTEIYSFANSKANFGTTYTVSDEDFQKLCDYVKLIYKDNEKTAANVINNLQQSRAAEWGGSCYGMALSAILDKSGQIGFNENFDSDAATLSEVSPPNENAAVESAINYYHISQRIPYLRGNLVTTYRKGASNWREGLESLVAAAQRGNPLLFCYSHSNYGHAIVIKGYTKGADGSHNLIAYDNRRPNVDTVIKIDKNLYSCIVGNTEDCLTFDFVEDMTPFDAIDIDGPENDYANFTLDGSSSGGGGNNKDLAEITIKSAGRVTVTNAEGETLIFDGGEYHGTMDVTSDYLDIGDGEGEDFTFTYTVNNSSSFTFTPEDEKLYVSVLSSDVYASAETDGATYSVISRDDGVSAFGTSFEYLLTLSVNDGVCDMVSVNGTTSETVNLSNNDVIKASGVDTQNGRVKIYSDTVNVDTYRYASGYSSFIIEELSDNPGDIRIMGSSNDDGVYDVNIGTIYVECQHEWDDGVVTTPASYDEDGVMTYTCRLCGETRTDVIPKLDPMPGDVHGDGVINAKDVAAIKEVLVGRYNAPNIAYVNCDIDGDGAVTAHDLAALKEMLVR